MHTKNRVLNNGHPCAAAMLPNYCDHSHGGSVAEWLARWTSELRCSRDRVQIAAVGFMTHITRRLTARNRDQLLEPYARQSSEGYVYFCYSLVTDLRSCVSWTNWTVARLRTACGLPENQIRHSTDGRLRSDVIPTMRISESGVHRVSTWAEKTSVESVAGSSRCHSALSSCPVNKTYTHTHTHLFNCPLCGTTRVSRYQKDKTNLDFTDARDSEWQWHQLGHMQVCTSLQTDNHASTPSLSFFTGRMPFLPPKRRQQDHKTCTCNVMCNGLSMLKLNEFFLL